VQQMEAGMPLALISLFCGVIALNAAVTAVLVWLPNQNMGRMHAVIDLAFDFIVAVVNPVAVVCYCITHFTIDRELLAINNVAFRPSTFERIAAVQSDPVQVAVIRHSLDSLRIASVLDVFTRVGLNLALCVRCHSLAHLIVASREIRQPRPNMYPRSRKAAVFFALLAVAIVGYTSGCVRATKLACAPHPECAQAAWRGVYRAQSHIHTCPCIAIIDREIHVRSVDQWRHPRDVTQVVAQLAMSGDLQTLQLVNRALPTLPESLRRCTNLRHM
jgi:hypothetical protein